MVVWCPLVSPRVLGGELRIWVMALERPGYTSEHKGWRCKSSTAQLELCSSGCVGFRAHV